MCHLYCCMCTMCCSVCCSYGFLLEFRVLICPSIRYCRVFYKRIWLDHAVPFHSNSVTIGRLSLLKTNLVYYITLLPYSSLSIEYNQLNIHYLNDYAIKSLFAYISRQTKINFLIKTISVIHITSAVVISLE